MNIHIVGVGAVGGLMAFYLKRALRLEADKRFRDGSTSTYGKSTITLHINRLPSTKAMCPDGTVAITVEQADGTMEREDGFLYELPGKPMADALPQANPIDVLIIALKSDLTIPVVSSLLPRMRREDDPHGPSTVVFLQNGVGHDDHFLSHFYPHGKAAHTAASPGLGVAAIARPYFLLNSNSHSTARREPLHVRHLGKNAFHFALPIESRFGSQWETIMMNHLNDSTHVAPPQTSSVANMIQLFSSSSLNIASDSRCILEPLPEFEVRVLQKLVVNCCCNPIGALYECFNGQIVTDPELNSLAQAITSECADVMRARWIATHQETEKGTVPVGIGYDSLMSYVTLLAQKCGNNRASMLQDILARRGATEIDVINGIVVAWGIQYGVPTPVNSKIVSLVKEKTERLRQEREAEDQAKVVSQLALA